MKKIILFFILSVSTVFASSYDELLLKTQISIFPKITILDKSLNKKLINNEIIYTIIYEKNDFLIAEKIKADTESIFLNSHIDTYKYKINLLNISSLSNQTKATVFYVLNLSKSDVKKVSQIAIKNNILTFSYDINNLYNGLLFSLNIEKSTVFYLNKKILSYKNINFVSPLLRMVKFIN